MNRYGDKLKSNLALLVAAAEQFLARPEVFEVFNAATARLVEGYRAGGRLYILGNGGSAADASHLAAEFVVKMGRMRQPLPAESLCSDVATLTAMANDFGYDEVFARQIEAKAGKNDMVLALSTSGQSPSVLRALEVCRKKGIPSLLLGGRDGGKARSLADFVILAPGETTSQIQELHILACHTLCECVENALFFP